MRRRLLLLPLLLLLLLLLCYWLLSHGALSRPVLLVAGCVRVWAVPRCPPCALAATRTSLLLVSRDWKLTCGRTRSKPNSDSQLSVSARLPSY